MYLFCQLEVVVFEDPKIKYIIENAYAYLYLNKE